MNRYAKDSAVWLFFFSLSLILTKYSVLVTSGTDEIFRIFGHQFFVCLFFPEGVTLQNNSHLQPNLYQCQSSLLHTNPTEDNTFRITACRPAIFAADAFFQPSKLDVFIHATDTDPSCQHRGWMRYSVFLYLTQRNTFFE